MRLYCVIKWANSIQLLFVLIILALSGCKHPGRSYRDCNPIEKSVLQVLPEKLSETGLYENASLLKVSNQNLSFKPAYALWTDSADKKRWVYLPPNTKINTQDMNNWRFPVGTKFWKEFSYNEVKVETRLLYKFGPDDADWAAVSYVWQDNKDAFKVEDGMENALGTHHDVPSASQCFGCHGGKSSRVLGFTAVQLAAGESSIVNSTAMFSHEIPKEISIPGDGSTRDLLGYVNANCSHCHNLNRPVSEGERCYDPEKNFDLSLYVDQLDRVEDTAFYQTAMEKIVQPGNAEKSKLFTRFVNRGRFLIRMPPVGTEMLDAQARTLFETWINGLDNNMDVDAKDN